MTRRILIRGRLRALHAVLCESEALWRPAPFRTRRPAWCAAHAELATAALALTDAEVERLAADPESCRRWVARWVPVVDALDELVQLPVLSERKLPPTDERLDRTVPGRKRSQIEAFVAHAPAARGPVLEWCAGKGHLGRRLALADDVPVRSLEIDPKLCIGAAELAARAGVRQDIVCADALAEHAWRQAGGRTVVALHACGELHRVLVRHAERAGAHGYHIAPCCYHLGMTEIYEPLEAEPSLRLDADLVRVAVTETVTAPRRIRERLGRDQAWKLGFVALRNGIEGETERRLRSVPASWLATDFATFCRTLAERERVRLPVQVDWTHWLAAGERRRAEVRRLELVRHVFRRALELWLVFDLAARLEAIGFAVNVGVFCARTLTPRNIMIVARADSRSN